ncbi:MAG TPA: hypothetical protein VK709_13435 [Candidatus Saccharimonadales bacterium]|jgi:hypothetical protein|nr:hypothetical protein [Candidatus Saccharimonadales bacterium]
MEPMATKEMETLLDSCTDLQAFLVQNGGKQIWPPKKFRKCYCTLADAGDKRKQVIGGGPGKKMLLGIVPGEGNEWIEIQVVGYAEQFAELRYRAFYLPSTLWYEFPFGSDKSSKRFQKMWDTISEVTTH